MEKKAKTGIPLKIVWQDTIWSPEITKKPLAAEEPGRNSTLIVITAPEPDEHAPRAA